MTRRPYCSGAAERTGHECRFCSPSRLERHESSCRGLRDWIHTLSGEHVRLASWDWEESIYMCERSWERYEAVVEKYAAMRELASHKTDGQRLEEAGK